MTIRATRAAKSRLTPGLSGPMPLSFIAFMETFLLRRGWISSHSHHAANSGKREVSDVAIRARSRKGARSEQVQGPAARDQSDPGDRARRGVCPARGRVNAVRCAARWAAGGAGTVPHAVAEVLES